jgi:hypothetical protein
LYYFSVGFSSWCTGGKKESVPKGEEAGAHSNQRTAATARGVYEPPFLSFSLFISLGSGWVVRNGRTIPHDFSFFFSLFFFLSLSLFDLPRRRFWHAGKPGIRTA